MTSQEKAKVLINKFKPHAQSMFSMNDGWDLEEEKRNTKIIVLFYINDLIDELVHIGINQDDKYGKDINIKPRLDYWNEVKLEIERF